MLFTLDKCTCTLECNDFDVKMAFASILENGQLSQKILHLEVSKKQEKKRIGSGDDMNTLNKNP